MRHNTSTSARLFFFALLDRSYLYVPVQRSCAAAVELCEQWLMTVARLNHIVRKCNILLLSKRLVKHYTCLLKDSTTYIQIRTATSPSVSFSRSLFSFDGSPGLSAHGSWLTLVLCTLFGSFCTFSIKFTRAIIEFQKALRNFFFFFFFKCIKIVTWLESGLSSSDNDMISWTWVVHICVVIAAILIVLAAYQDPFSIRPSWTYRICVLGGSSCSRLWCSSSGGLRCSFWCILVVKVHLRIHNYSQNLFLRDPRNSLHDSSHRLLKLAPWSSELLCSYVAGGGF